MKLKALTKLIGIVTASSMLAGSLPALADENSSASADTITVEFENYTADKNNEGSGFAAVGDCAQIFTDKIKDDDYRNFYASFNVQTAGYYTLDIIAACYVAGATVWLSDLSYSLNGGESKDINTGNRIAGRIDSAGTFVRTDFAKAEDVYLNEGENTISFSCKERSSGSDKIVAALDKAIFTPKNVIPSSGIIELENYASDNGVETLWQKSASRYQVTKTADKAKKEELFTVKVNVGEDAEYSLGVAAGCSAYLGWLSPLQISVNGGAFEELADYNRMDYSKDSSTFGTALFTRPASVTLNKGENTIVIKATERAAGGVFYSLDYISLEKMNVIKDLAENGRIEAEDYAAQWNAVKRAHESGSGISAVKTISDADTDEVSLTVNVLEEGDYAVAVRAGCSAWAEWLSPLSVSFNGGEYENLESYGVSGVVNNSSDGLRCARMTRQKTLHLNAGKNKISFKAAPRAAGGIYYSIDYIDLVKVQNAENISLISSDGRIEMEDYAEQIGMTAGKLDVASSGASAMVKNAAGESDVVSIAFMSNEKKTVNFQVGIASQAWALWLSPVYIQLNGAEADDPVNYTRLAIQGGNDGFRNADMLKNEAVELNEGLNIITFIVKQRSAQYNGGIYYGLDYIEFTKANEPLTAPELVMQTELEVGDESEIQIMDGSEFVTLDRVYQITYKSGNEAVATVDGNGKLSAVSPGSAEITVAIRVNVNSEEIVLKKTVTVEGKDQLISVSAVSKNNAAISFNVKSSTELDAADVYIAGYDVSGALVSVKKHSIKGLAAGDSKMISDSLDDYEKIESVKIFVWMDMYPLINGVDA